MTSPARLRQHVRYVTASDGTRLAWAESGAGPVVVKAANWLTHLEYEWESPVWKHWIQFFSAHSRFVRYDERGCGMSEWQSGAADRRSVGRRSRIGHRCRSTDGAGDAVWHLTGRGRMHSITRFEHPERVARMILYGGYARGAVTCAIHQAPGAVPSHGGPGARGPGEATTRRSVRSSRRGSFPAAVREQLQWFNDLCLKTTSGDIIATPAGGARASWILPRHSVMCARRRSSCTRAVTRWCRSRKGDCLASGIPGSRVRRARLAQSHPARARAGVAAVLRGGARVSAAAEQRQRDSVFAALSARERQVLALMAEGLSNTDIAEQLDHQREDGAQSRIESVRQARRVVPRAGDRVRARPRV